MSLWPKIEKLLKHVEKPSRYINNELNSIKKELDEKIIRVGLAYPDVYEVGLPNLGLQILYEIINKKEWAYAERLYAPWVDMEKLMREQNVPLFTLETHSKASDLDILGFSLQHELIYTNVLNMLDLAGIPVLSVDRGLHHPLIIAGGPGASNPEPMSDFIDLFVIGEAEELIIELLEVYKGWKLSLSEKDCINNKELKDELLIKLAQIPGAYVPKFYNVSYYPDGKVKNIEPNHNNIPAKVKRRVVKDLSKVEIPLKPIVPYMEAVHDRCVVEVMRGCTRGCRFCQAGIIYRPVRERAKEQVFESIKEILNATGHRDISLSSLSTADYSLVETVLNQLNEEFSSENISISLPSLRVDAFSVNLADEIVKGKRTGLTFAPEAGSQRLRNVINKNVTEKDILDTASLAFEKGWQKIKLYFMIGLPTETQEDLDGIFDLANKIVNIGLEKVGKAVRKRLQITVNISSFAPKAHTPFQWVAQNSISQFEEKHSYLIEKIKGKYLQLRWQNPQVSILEGALARGDRRLGKVILRAWQLGAKFDAWTQIFNFEKWDRAFKGAGLDINFYTIRARQFDEKLPWDHIDSGCSKAFLKKEFTKALEGQLTEDCRSGECVSCGVCPSLDAGNIIQQPN